MAIPLFDSDGLLPPGDYVATIEEIRQSVLVEGPMPMLPSWDKERRYHLSENLEIIVQQLWKIGIAGIYVNGSFAEDRLHPNWDPSRRIHDAATGKGQLPMWWQYKVEACLIMDKVAG